MGWLVPRQGLTNDQVRAVQMGSTAHQLVVGSPGSGKTIVLVHRAKHLAETFEVSSERFRILVYTNALKDYIKTGLEDLALQETSVSTFDHWCKEFHEEHIGKVPFKKGPDFAGIREATWKFLQSQSKSTPIFDFVMVDEGQDLPPIAYQVLNAVSQHVTVFADSKQQLYEEGASEQRILTSLGLRKPKLTLLDAYRCSPYVVRIGASFVKDKGERDAFINQNPPIDKGQRETPVLYIAENDDSELANLAEMVKDCVARGDRIAVLLPQNKQVAALAHKLSEKGVDIEIPAKLLNWKSFQNGTFSAHDFGSPLPKLMSFPSAKGLTFDSVLMPLFQREKFIKGLSEDILARWIFVGTTRATKWVYYSAVKESMCEKKFRKLKKQGQITILQGKSVRRKRANQPRVGSNESTGDDDFSDIF